MGASVVARHFQNTKNTQKMLHNILTPCHNAGLCRYCHYILHSWSQGSCVILSGTISPRTGSFTTMLMSVTMHVLHQSSVRELLNTRQYRWTWVQLYSNSVFTQNCWSSDMGAWPRSEPAEVKFTASMTDQRSDERACYICWGYWLVFLCNGFS